MPLSRLSVEVGRSPDTFQVHELRGPLRRSWTKNVLQVQHLPLALPGIAAGSIFTFSLTLGDYIIPQVIGDSTNYIGQVVYKQQGVAGNVPFAAAFSLVPIVVIGAWLWLARRLGPFDAH